MVENRSNDGEEFSRREAFRRFGRKAAQVGAYSVLGTSFVEAYPRIPELFLDQKSSFLFEPEQLRLLESSDSICLVFGGSTLQNADIVAKPITSVLAPLGPVGYTNYGVKELDVQSLADQVKALGKKKVSVVGHSLGTEVAGAMFELLGDEVQLGHLIMLSTPTSVETTDNVQLSKDLAKLPIGRGLVDQALTAYIYGNPWEPGKASPELLWEEGESILSERYIVSLSERARKDGGAVSFITPENFETDNVIDVPASIRRSKQLFPNMNVYFVGGEKQGHANPDRNGAEYRRAITKAISEAA